jgi:hypothetical protein
MSSSAAIVDTATGSDAWAPGFLWTDNPATNRVLAQVLAGEAGFPLDPVCSGPDRPTGAESLLGESLFRAPPRPFVPGWSHLTAEYMPLFGFAELARLVWGVRPAFSVQFTVQRGPAVELPAHAATEEPAAAVAATLRSDSLEPNVAAELRELSGLDAGALAEIFGVSRTAYQNWIGGAQPHRARRERLHMLKPLFREAARRLGSRSAVERWLLTPIVAGGKRPLDYLRNGDDAVVRGLLLREGTSSVRLVPPDKRRAPRRLLSPEEFASALEDVRPAPAIEPDEWDAEGEAGPEQ